MKTTNHSNDSGLSIYRRLITYVVPHWKIFAAATLSMVFYAATDTGFAALMQPMLDGTFVEKDPEIIRLVPIALIVLFVLRGITGFISEYGITWVGRNIIHCLRNEMFQKLLYMPSAFYNKNPSGKLISLLTYNVEQVAKASTNAITIIIRDSLTVVFLLGWMLYISGKLALFFLFLGPVIAILVRYISKRFRRISSRIQGSMGNVTQVVSEIIDGHKVVKTFSGHEQEAANFERINNRNRQLHMKMVATSATSVPVVQLIAACTLAGIVYMATQEPVLHTLTVGMFVSFITAMLLLLPPLKRLTTVTSSLQRGIAAAESIFALLDAESEKDTGDISISRAQGSIEFREVTFSYEQSDRPALNNISLKVKRGETVAIVGRSGSGKTTLVNLVMRFYDPTQGSLHIDDHDSREYKLQELRNQIAMVGQDTILFNDTIEKNIAYGSLDSFGSEQVKTAATAAHAMEFIERLPEGMQTQVGENGMLLSGGQRQRLAIARAILKNAPILILDEATSSLDTESEQKIQSALDTLVRDRTTLVIAHRLSTVKSADRIIVMDSGRIVEQGTHDELLQLGGHYSNLYHTQFEHAGVT